MPNGHPIDVEITGPVQGGSDFTATVTMDQTVTADTTINLSTSSSVVTGPSGAAFPTTATVLSGQNSVVVPLGCTNPPSSITVTITASANGSSANGTVRIAHKTT